ncbi:winged helix-turn-helix domain-containing protein [Streptomyces sp. NPDC001508]|uniref:ArsR/SmtB family transcription factor n=1 Tax=Streptomyces sp. NPDC001508 TaxID=3154656 RepID=UPI0033345561
MYRIFLSADDLARIRISDGDIPLLETIFALDRLLDTEEEGFHEWRRRVRRQLMTSTASTERVARLLRLAGNCSGLLDLCLGAQHPHVVSAVKYFSQLAVAPHWERIGVHLDSARESLRHIMGRDGVGALLGNLGAGIRWKPPVLEIDGVGPGELKPAGRGLVLTPSLFLHRPAHVARFDRGDPQSAPILAFPNWPRSQELPSLLAGADAVRGGRSADVDSLAALVGRTRAAALRAVEEGCGNAELAERLGVTTAAVSQHAAVLRAAGLISTCRRGSHAVHTVTHLGTLLLRGNGAELRRVLPVPAQQIATRQPTIV